VFVPWLDGQLTAGEVNAASAEPASIIAPD